MPKQFDSCVLSLTGSGYSPDQSCRACSSAFWQAHGMTPGVALARGFDPAGDISGAASVVAAELSEQGDSEAVLVSSGLLLEVSGACLSDYGPASHADESTSSLLRECEVLAPGDYNGFTFTPEMLADYAANYSPSDPPPIIKDHDLANADNCFGYVRGLRYNVTTQRLLALSEFLGQHAIDRVRDRRWKKLSGRFVVSKNPANRIMTELSITLRPAYTGSRIGARKLEETTMPKKIEAALAQEAPAAAPPAEVATPAAEMQSCPDCSAEVAPGAKFCPECGASMAPVEAPLSVAKSDIEVALEQIATERAELAAQKEEIKLAAIARRSSEDEKDWQLLLAQGYTVPHLKDKEIGFMGTLSEGQKTAFLSLRQGMDRQQMGRVSKADPIARPDATAPDIDNDKQQILLESMRGTAGITSNGQVAK